MTGFPKSTRALLLAVLASSIGVVHSTPVNFDSATTTTITPCATVKCTSTTTCAVIAGKAQCVPIPTTIPGGGQCGTTVCAAGLTCCNPSCGVCVKPGVMCTQQVCPPVGVQCGTTVCAAGLTCCNPSCGVCVKPGVMCTLQVCPPVGVQCGTTVCEAGLTCCNPSCGVCVKPGMMCTQQVCPSPDALPLDTTTTTETTRSLLPDPVPVVKCGAAVCKPGLECCNASCGTCVEPGKGCTKQFCLPPVPVDQQCGSNVCAKGQFCCNRSCGICAPIDGACTQQFCG